MQGNAVKVCEITHIVWLRRLGWLLRLPEHLQVLSLIDPKCSFPDPLHRKQDLNTTVFCEEGSGKITSEGRRKIPAYSSGEISPIFPTGPNEKRRCFQRRSGAPRIAPTLRGTDGSDPFGRCGREKPVAIQVESYAASN
jgi:hypothetical protein